MLGAVKLFNSWGETLPEKSLVARKTGSIDSLATEAPETHCQSAIVSAEELSEAQIRRLIEFKMAALERYNRRILTTAERQFLERHSLRRRHIDAICRFQSKVRELLRRRTARRQAIEQRRLDRQTNCAQLRASLAAFQTDFEQLDDSSDASDFFWFIR